MNKEEIIDNLVSQLNLGRIHAAMVALDWRWLREDGEMRVPTIDEIDAHAREIAEGCLEPNRSGYASGGFFAWIIKTPEGGRTLELSFSIEDAAVEIGAAPNQDGVAK